MTSIYFDLAVQAVPPDHDNLLERLREYPKAYWGERVRRAQLRRDIRRLRQMSDYHLEDIGLRRTDVGDRFSDLGAVRPDLLGFLDR